MNITSEIYTHILSSASLKVTTLSEVLVWENKLFLKKVWEKVWVLVWDSVGNQKKSPIFEGET